MQRLELPLQSVQVIVILVITLPITAPGVRPALRSTMAQRSVEARRVVAVRRRGGGGEGCAASTGERGVRRGGEGGRPRGGGGGGHHRDAKGVIVGETPPLGLLQDVFRVVHRDNAAVRDEVRQDEAAVVIWLVRAGLL